MKEINELNLLAEQLKHRVYSRLCFVDLDIKIDELTICTTFCLN
jgi:hypothetical protein